MSPLEFLLPLSNYENGRNHLKEGGRERAKRVRDGFYFNGQKSNSYSVASSQSHSTLITGINRRGRARSWERGQYRISRGKELPKLGMGKCSLLDGMEKFAGSIDYFYRTFKAQLQHICSTITSHNSYCSDAVHILQMCSYVALSNISDE